VQRPSTAYDEQVIPTLSKAGGPGKRNEGGDGGGADGLDGQDGKIEEISPENMKYAESLIPVFGEEIVKKMFSRPWAVRDEGLKECEDHVKKNGNDLQVF
jgi:hypothetical protein